VIQVKKSTITRTWIGGLVVFAAGIVLSMVGVGLMLAYGGTFTQIAGTTNYEFTPAMNDVFWSTIVMIVIGGLVALVGSVFQFVAWIAGMFNSYLLPSKGWFTVLIAGGLLSFLFAPLGFAAMLAYVVAAPEGELYARRPEPALQQQMPPLAQTT
jgi:hypothetical protein